MTPAARIAGRVVDVEGEPLEGVRVVAGSIPLPTMSSELRSRMVATTDERGHFAFNGVEQGAIALFVYGGGFVSQGLAAARVRGFNPFRHDVAGASLDGIELVAVAAPIVRGRLQDTDGTPISGAVVVARAESPGRDTFRDPSLFEASRRGVSGADGTFEFHGLVPDRRWTVSADGPHIEEAGSAPFTPSPTLAAITLVTDHTGKFARVGADGTFRVEGTPPAKLRLTVWTYIGKPRTRGKTVTFDWNDPDIVVPMPDPK